MRFWASEYGCCWVDGDFFLVEETTLVIDEMVEWVSGKGDGAVWIH